MIVSRFPNSNVLTMAPVTLLGKSNLFSMVVMTLNNSQIHEYLNRIKCIKEVNLLKYPEERACCRVTKTQQKKTKAWIVANRWKHFGRKDIKPQLIISSSN